MVLIPTNQRINKDELKDFLRTELKNYKNFDSFCKLVVKTKNSNGGNVNIPVSSYPLVRIKKAGFSNMVFAIGFTKDLKDLAIYQYFANDQNYLFKFTIPAHEVVSQGHLLELGIMKQGYVKQKEEAKRVAAATSKPKKETASNKKEKVKPTRTTKNPVRRARRRKTAKEG